MAGFGDNPLFAMTGLDRTGPLSTLQALQASRGSIAGGTTPNGLSIGSLNMGAPKELNGYNAGPGDKQSVPLPDLSAPDISTAMDEGASRAERDAKGSPRMAASGSSTKDEQDSGGAAGMLGFSPKLLDLARAMAPNSDDRANSLAAAGIGMAQAGSHGSDFLSALASGAGTGMDFFQKQRAMRAEQALKSASFQSEDQLRQAQIANLQSEAQIRSLPYQIAGFTPSQAGNGPGAPPGGPGAGPPAPGAPPSAAPGMPTSGGPPQGGAMTAPAPAAQTGAPYMPDGVTPQMYAITQKFAALPPGTPMGDAARKQLTDWAQMSPGYVRQKARAEGQGRIDSGEVIINPGAGQVSLGGNGPPQQGVATPPPAVTSPPNAVVPAAASPTQQAIPSPIAFWAGKALPQSQPTNVNQASQDKAAGEALGKLPAQIDSKADAARDQNYQLDQMMHESTGFQMGKGADLVGEGQAWLVGLNKQLPKDMQVDLGDQEKSAGDIQAFNKNSMELARQVVRATSARAAYQEMAMIQKALPQATMTENAFHQIGSQLQGANDFAVAERKAKDQWLVANHNNMAGFETNFNDNFSPATFMMNRLDDTARQSVISDLSKTKTGTAMLTKWAKQAQLGRQLGLMGQ